MTLRRLFLQSPGRWAALLCAAIIALHLGLRTAGWRYEWLRTVLIVSFACVFLGPLAAGVGAVEGGRWARARLTRAIDRPHEAIALRAWAALATWLAFPIPVAFLVAAGFAKANGLPGSPSPVDLAPIVTADSLMVGWMTIGFALGWRSRAHTILAPFVTAVAFAITLALWGSRAMIVDTGGTFDSLVGMRMSPWVLRGQATFWFGAILLGLVLLATRRHRPFVSALGFIALLAMTLGVQFGLRADGLTFTRGAARLHCVPIDSGIPLCLAPGYERFRPATASAMEAALGPWSKNALPLPDRITQDSDDVGDAIMWVSGAEIVHSRVGDIQARLAMSLVPSGCNYWERPATSHALDLIMGTVITEPVPGETPPAGATGPDHATQVRNAVRTIHACAAE